MFGVIKRPNRGVIPPGKIYGAEWAGGSSSAWTRTDDAASFVEPNPYYVNMSGTPSSPFDNILPWSGMQIVEDSSAGTLVEIPKFYYKWTRNGAAMKLQISMDQHDGFFVSPAHADRGDGVGERDYVYVGRYHCSSSNYKSATNVKPKQWGIGSFRSYVHSLGSYVWQNDFALFWTVRMLYLVEFADWNCQQKIGLGCGTYKSLVNNGMTDSMPYHTGRNIEEVNSSSHTQYRHIENLWGNGYDWVDGVYVYGSYPYSAYVINNPSDFGYTNGVNVGTVITGASSGEKFISSWSDPSSISGFEYALVPNGNSGSSSTYICDGLYGSLSGTISSPLYISTGGYYYSTSDYGLFFMQYNSTSTTYTSRLMVLPPARLTA